MNIWAKRIMVFLLIFAMIFTLVAYVYAKYWVRPEGFWLGGKIILTYEDGSKITLSSGEKNLLTDALWKLSVLTNEGKKLYSISADAYVKYLIKPSGRSLHVQDWYQFYIEISGTYADGAREYDPLTGFLDLFYNSYQDTQKTSRWILLYNNPGASWTGLTDFVKYFYKEAGSGVQAGLLNIGPVEARAVDEFVVKALGSGIVAKQLGDKLTGWLGVGTVKTGDVKTIISWYMKGWDFYNYLKRMNWLGLSIHIGEFSVGLGKWVRMHDGDTYTINFKVGYFYRWQDVTGEWTDWRAGTITLATLTLKVEQGTWYVLNIDISGDVNTSYQYGSIASTTFEVAPRDEWLPPM